MLYYLPSHNQKEIEMARRINVAVTEKHSEMLDELVSKRKKEESPIDSKTKVIAELIANAHKKEIKK
jgi:hypothetical protein